MLEAYVEVGYGRGRKKRKIEESDCDVGEGGRHGGGGECSSPRMMKLEKLIFECGVVGHTGDVYIHPLPKSYRVLVHFRYVSRPDRSY